MAQKAEKRESAALVKLEGDALVEVGDFKTALDVEHQKYLALQEYLDKHLTKDVHYGAVPGIPKPFLHKPGAEAVCKALHLTATFEQTEKQVSEDSGFVLFSYKCQMHHCVRDKNGNVIADEVVAELEASANSFEPGKRFRWTGKGPDRKRHERDAKELLGEYHNIMTLAEKRAYVGAAIQAAGLSHKFTYAEGAFEHEQKGSPCPKCKDGTLRECKGKSGTFWGCSNYYSKGARQCSHTQDEDPEKTSPPAQADAKGPPPGDSQFENPCPECAEEEASPDGVCHRKKAASKGMPARVCTDCNEKMLLRSKPHTGGKTHWFWTHGRGAKCKKTLDLTPDEKEGLFAGKK